MKAAASPDAFVAELSGWRGELVAMLRAAIGAGAAFDDASTHHVSTYRPA